MGTMLRNRRHLHRWAVLVLFLWVFGIGASFANACLTAKPAVSSDAEAVRFTTTHATDDHAATSSEVDRASHDATPQVGATHDEGPGNANCQDFCDKSAISIPPLKSALDLAQADALLLPVAAILYSVAACEPVQWWLPRRDGGLAPPITITLLRLAL
jgi:hypothetical protein